MIQFWWFIQTMCGVQGLQNWYIIAVCTSNDMLQLAKFQDIMKHADRTAKIIHNRWPQLVLMNLCLLGDEPIAITLCPDFAGTNPGRWSCFATNHTFSFWSLTLGPYPLGYVSTWLILQKRDALRHCQVRGSIDTVYYSLYSMIKKTFFKVSRWFAV